MQSHKYIQQCANVQKDFMDQVDNVETARRSIRNFSLYTILPKKRLCYEQISS